MSVLVVLNTHAGAGLGGRAQDRIQRAFEAAGIGVSVQRTRAPGEASAWVAQADFDGVEAVVAAGGDGTVFEVLNGLYARDPEDRPPLGVIPVGTGNAFARDLGLARGDVPEAVARIARMRTRKVDVGRVEGDGDRFHFLNILGIGLPVNAGLTSQRLKFMGQSAYTLGTLWEVLGLSDFKASMELDGQVVDGSYVFVEISNTRYTGTNFKIAPQAVMDDGLLDVTLLCPLSRRRLLRLFPTVYSGAHLEFEEVRTHRARCIRITAPEGMLMAVDGEFRGRTPVVITCLERDLELLA